MRACRRGWRFGGLALALSAPALLAGCAIAPGESDQQIGDAWSELDPMTSEEVPGGDEEADGVDDGLDAPGRGLASPPQLRLRDLAHPSLDDVLSTKRTYARSQKQSPDPLPWQPQGSTDGHDKASSESDGTR
ncbi:MAG TPA: hypothetical protein VL242_03180 [Sorangium sp.]|uniref:hypothetical protein n=1 Tax=unclassified Sorangium TaxID=2621164 RepID=UPI002C96D538|nr:hypothetical protein [Sorangium sp.]